MKRFVSKRIIALLLCFVISLNCIIPAFAADPIQIPNSVSYADLMNELNAREVHDVSVVGALGAVGSWLLAHSGQIITALTIADLLGSCVNQVIDIFDQDTYDDSIDQMNSLVGSTTASSVDQSYIYLDGWMYEVDNSASNSDTYVTEAHSGYLFASFFTPSSGNKSDKLYFYSEFTVPVSGSYTININGLKQVNQNNLTNNGSGNYKNRVTTTLLASNGSDWTTVSSTYQESSSAGSSIGVASCKPVTAFLSKGVTYRIQYVCNVPKAGQAYSVLARPYMVCTDVVNPSALYLDGGYMSAGTRMGNWPIQYVYAGDSYIDESTNEEITNYYYTNNPISFVDESQMLYYNPVTNTYYDMTGWTYDYSTRTYNITTDDSQTYTVTYGDQYVTVNEGDTVYNYYYYADENVNPDIWQDIKNDQQSSCDHEYIEEITSQPTCTKSGSATYTCSKCGISYDDTVSATGHNWTELRKVNTEYDENGELLQEGYTLYQCSVCGEQYKDTDGSGAPGNSGDNSSGSGGVWDKLGNLLGSVAGGAVSLIGSALSTLLDALISLVNGLVERLSALVDSILGIFQTLPQLGGGFLTLLGSMFSFLPSEMVMLLEFALIAVVALIIIKALRR